MVPLRGLDSFARLPAGQFPGMPVFPFTRFNNTLVMGSLLLAAALCAPLFRGVMRLVASYSEGYQEKVQNWKLIRILKGSSLFRFLSGVDKLGGR